MLGANEKRGVEKKIKRQRQQAGTMNENKNSISLTHQKPKITAIIRGILTGGLGGYCLNTITLIKKAFWLHFRHTNQEKKTFFTKCV